MYDKLTPSITHSEPAYSAPTLANPLPDFHIFFPISLNTSLTFNFVDKLAYCGARIGSSIAKDELIREKKAPIPNPVQSILISPLFAETMKNG